MSQGFDEVSCTNVTGREKKSAAEEKSAGAALQRRKSGSLFYVLRHCMNSDLPIAEPD